MSDPRNPGTLPADEAGDPKRWLALTVCLIAGFMTLLDVSIVNVAFPSMESGLHASPADISWVRAGYTLTFGLVLVPSGKIGDALGRKRIFLIGVLMFTVVSLLCAVSPDPTWLVVTRLLQGVAGGLLSPARPRRIGNRNSRACHRLGGLVYNYYLYHSEWLSDGTP